MRFATIASVLELPHARALAAGLAEHHPDATLHVLLVGSPRLADEPFATLSVDELGIPGWQRLGEFYEPGDLRELYRPHLLSQLLGRADEPLVLLDAAHDLLGELAPVRALLERHPIVLSPRVAGELPEDVDRPSNADLRAVGRIDPGFVALRPSQEAERFLAWWAQRIDDLMPYLGGTRGVGKPEQGRRQLRRVLELAPSLFPEAAELDDAGCEVSAWNLHERPLAREAGAVTAGGRPLLSLSLVGFRPDRPHLLDAIATRVTPAREPVLRELLLGYAERLREHGWRDLGRRGDVGRRLANGVVFSDRLLRLYSEALVEGEDFGDIFSPQGTARFLRWLLEPSGPGATAGVSRYLYRVYRDRPDIPLAYPDLAADAASFIGWAWVYGRRELEIPEELLPPPPAGLRVERSAAAAAAGDGAAAAGAVNVAGYFTGTLGLGEAARLYVAALGAAGVPVRTTTVEAQLPVDRRPRDGAYGTVAFDELAEHAAVVANLICVNAAELPRFAAEVGPGFFQGRRNIGVWAWETDVIPSHWDEAFAHLDEIWVYTRYVAENLGRVSPVPVVVVPPPVSPPPPGEEPNLGLPDGFRFMFMFDFFSTPERKNPLGAIEAFKRAFAPGEGPHLLIKTIHAEHRRAAYEELAYAAAGRDDVRIVDESLPVAQKNGLLASCDCYVSLHRSEGFGLPLAECMAMGKPVIATGYSGNLDFMTPANSYLVDHTLRHVGAGVEIYPAEGSWAEPDLDDAALQMRAVWERRDEAAAKGARAAADIAALLSPARTGAIAAARLRGLDHAGAARRSLAEIDRRLGAIDAAPARGARGWARRAVMRGARPVIARQREIDREILSALRELRADVDALARALRERS